MKKLRFREIRWLAYNQGDLSFKAQTPNCQRVCRSQGWSGTERTKLGLPCHNREQEGCALPSPWQLITLPSAWACPSKSSCGHRVSPGERYAPSNRGALFELYVNYKVVKISANFLLASSRFWHALDPLSSTFPFTLTTVGTSHWSKVVANRVYFYFHFTEFLAYLLCVKEQCSVLGTRSESDPIW